MKKYYPNAFFDLSTSVNRDVAIGILLGLRTLDPVRPNRDPQGDPDAEQSKYLAGLEVSIYERISDMRDDAQNDVDDAIEENDPGKRDKGKTRVMYCDELMRLAHRYSCDITYELSKGEKSMLKADPAATKRPDDPYIEIASLDEWAQVKYKIPIYKIQGGQPVNDGTLVRTEVKDEEDTSQIRPDVGKVKTDNLYILLAFFVEAFATTAPIYKDGDDPNAIKIGERFEKIVTASNNNNPLTGHTAENIRKVIAEAMKRKQLKQLKRCYVGTVLQPVPKD